jgi:hypothetical protein
MEHLVVVGPKWRTGSEEEEEVKEVGGFGRRNCTSFNHGAEGGRGAEGAGDETGQPHDVQNLEEGDELGSPHRPQNCLLWADIQLRR